MKRLINKETKARIHFLNVNEGDCTIIEHESGRITMIDICAGNLVENNATEIQEEYGFIKEASVRGNFNQKKHPVNPINYMKKYIIGKNIHRFILTHPDMDHMDGLNNLLKSYHVTNFWDIENNKEIDNVQNKYDENDWKVYQEIRNGEYDGKIKVLNLLAGAEGKFYNQDGLCIISPTRDLVRIANEKKKYNDISYVILFECCEMKILFCGDTEKIAWEEILKGEYSQCIKDVDVLIAPHHGRSSGGNKEFLDVIKPSLVLIGNARSEYLDYQKYNKYEHYTNNQCGNIVMEIMNNGCIDLYCSNKNYVKDENINVYEKNGMWLLKKLYKKL